MKRNHTPLRAWLSLCAIWLSMGSACTIHETDAVAPSKLDLHYNGCTAVFEGGRCQLPSDGRLSVWNPSLKQDLIFRFGVTVVEVERDEVNSGMRYEFQLSGEPGLLQVFERDGVDPIWSLEVTDHVPEPEALLEAKTLRKERKLDEAIERTRSLGADSSLDQQAKAAGLRARIHRDAGRLQDAIESYSEAITLHQKSGNQLEWIRDATTLVYVHLQNRTSLTEARRILTTIAGELPYHSHSEYRVAYFQGLLATHTGNHKKAVSYLRQAVDVATRMGKDRLRSYARQVLSLTLETTGRVDEALALMREDLDALPTEGAACDRLFLLNNYAWMGLLGFEAQTYEQHDQSRTLIDLTEIVDLLNEAIDVARADCASFQAQEINAYLNLAFAQFHRGQIVTAKKALNLARGVSQKLTPYYELWALDIEARIAEREGNLTRAAELYSAMLTTSGIAASPSGRWRALAGLATTYDSRGNRVEAQRRYAEAEALLQNDSLLIPLHGGRDAFLSGRNFLTRRYVASLLADGRDQSALHVVRRARSRYLSELQMADKLAHLRGRTKLEWEAAINLYQHKRKEMEALAAKAWSIPASELASFNTRKAALETATREALDTALGIIQSASGQSPEAWRTPVAGELFLVYYELEEGWVGFAQTTDGLAWEMLGKLDLVRSTDEVLGQRLLAPFESYIAKADRIVLMPWGDTQALDVHALPVGGKPLMGHGTTVYSLDLSGYQPRALRTKTLVASDSRGDLPKARAEGLEVTTILRAQGASEVEHLSGSEVTLAALTSRFQAVELFHYAGHGTFRGEGGWASALPLADDAELNLSDILALDEAPRYVVLTGCETARSSTKVKVESAGIAQAFVLSGSAGVIAATRPIRDELGIAVAQGLYRRFTGGMTLEASFRAAILEIAEREPNADWKSFRLLTP